MATYAETACRLNEIISNLGFPLCVGEAKEAETVKALRKEVGAYYNQLGKENKLDVLHAYDAENKAELLNKAVAEMFNRIEEVRGL